MSLEEAVEKQLHYLQQLQLLLETELHLISSRDAESLMNLLNEKQSTLENIRQQDELIANLYAELGDPETAKQKLSDKANALFDDAKQLLEDVRQMVREEKKEGNYEIVQPGMKAKEN